MNVYRSEPGERRRDGREVRNGPAAMPAVPFVRIAGKQWITKIAKRSRDVTGRRDGLFRDTRPSTHVQSDDKLSGRPSRAGDTQELAQLTRALANWNRAEQTNGARRLGEASWFLLPVTNDLRVACPHLSRTDGIAAARTGGRDVTRSLTGDHEEQTVV